MSNSLPCLILTSCRAASRACVALYAVSAWGGGLSGQPGVKIQIRTLAPSTAVSKDSVGPIVAVRPLSSGGVLVNDFQSGRVVLFDANLAQAKVVIDTIGGVGPGAPLKVVPPAATLIRYLGDSPLYPDRLGNSLLVLDANGKVARVMSVPKPSDVVMLTFGGQAGHPGLDSRGRLVYRGIYRPAPPKGDPDRPWIPRMPVQADSAPIVRADLDTRTIDTLTALKLTLGVFFNKLEVDNDGNVIMRMWANPLDVDDQWALLSDGTIAVMSVHDYHTEWTDTNDTPLFAQNAV